MIKVTQGLLKSQIKNDGVVIGMQRIKYPSFSCEHEKYKDTCKKMNEFYTDIAKRYSKHIHTKLSGHSLKDGNLSVGMTYHVTKASKAVISVVLDLYFQKGREVRKKRFSQMWHVTDGSMLLPKDIVKTDNASRKKLFSHVLGAASRASGGLYDNVEGGLHRLLAIENCFAVPEGLCFFVNAYSKPLQNDTALGFVVKKEQLKELEKWDFLS